MAEDNNKSQGFSPDQVNKMFSFWAEMTKLPTIGPMYAFSKDFGEYANDLVKLGKVMSEMKSHMDNYWTMVNAAYMRASKETAERGPKQFVTKEDFESFRRAGIEAFEDAFTELFASAEFSTVYGKVFSSQLDFSRAVQSIAEKNFKVLNLPTRSVIDEILKDIHELKKSVRELRKSVERDARVST